MKAQFLGYKHATSKAGNEYLRVSYCIKYPGYTGLMAEDKALDVTFISDVQKLKVGDEVTIDFDSSGRIIGFSQ